MDSVEQAGQRLHLYCRHLYGCDWMPYRVCTCGLEQAWVDWERACLQARAETWVAENQPDGFHH